MATTKGTAVAKARINLPTDVNAEMAAEIAALQNRTAPAGGDAIRFTQSKQFKFPDGQSSDGPFECIVVDFAAAYFYYEGAYDRDNVVPPVCFALGLEPGGLTPDAKATEPQAASCAACWANQFGSSGKGKACQNARLLAVLPLDATEETPLWVLKVSPTAIRGFDAYVNTVARKYQKPVRGVVTAIGFDPNSEYATLRFADAGEASTDLVLLAHTRKGEAMTRLLQAPDYGPAAEQKTVKAPVSRKPAAAKPAATKAAARR